MPSCANCQKFDPTTNTCTVKEGSPGRKCVIALLEQKLAPIRDMVVCEVGPGPFSYAKEILERNNNQWFGVDPKSESHLGVPSIRTHEGTVSNLPFEANSIDLVVANQSMEHWYEFGTPFRQGLSEVYRVLKPGGRAIINVPIHLHGHRIFVVGDLAKIRRLFTERMWASVEFEEWRRDFKPLEPWQGWKLARPTIADDKIPDANNASTWILDIVATKAAATKTGFDLELQTRLIDARIRMGHILGRARAALSNNSAVRKAYRAVFKRR